MLGSPRLEHIAVDIQTTRRTGRAHRAVVAVVESVTANRVGEVNRKVEAVESNRRTETAVEVGQRGLANLHVVGLTGVVHLLHALRMVVLVLPSPVHGLTRIGINACIALDVPVVEGFALGHPEVAALITGIMLDELGRQTVDDVLVVGHVEVQIPLHVLRADYRTVQGQLDTCVVYVADVVVVVRITHRQRHGQTEEHVRSLAVEVLDRTAQAALPEAEVNTGVDVGVGLPRNVGITLRIERTGNLTTCRLNLPQVGVAVLTDTVVTLLTYRSLDFQHVDPGSIEPVLLVDKPCGAQRVEVTPTVVGMEARRCIATIRTADEVLVVVVVLDTTEISFGVVAVFIRGIRTLNDCTSQLEQLVREHVRRRGVEHRALALVVLVTNHDVDGVLVVESLVVAENLLHVEREEAVVLLAQNTVHVLVTAVVGVGEVGIAGLVEVDTDVELELKVLEESGLCKCSTGEGVADDLALDVELLGGNGVRTGHHGTLQAGDTVLSLARTVIVAQVAVLVAQDVAVLVTNVERVDRAHLGYHTEEVRYRVRAIGGLLEYALRVVVGVAGVGTHLEPLLYLVVGLQSSGVTLHVGVGHDTLVVHVAERTVEAAAVVRSRHVDVVLLTHRGVESGILPVIGSQQVAVAVRRRVDVAQRGVGVDFTVGADEILALGHIVNLITEAANQLVVGVALSGRSSVTEFIDTIIIHGTVNRLVVESRIVHVLVVANGTRVDTHLGIDRNDCIAALAALGGHHDDTVGTTRTVEGRRGSVLEDGQVLDVVRVDEGQVTVIGDTVDNPQRVGARRDGADTANHHLGSRTGLTRSGLQLNTGRSTRKQLSDVRRLHLGDILGFNHRSRTGERFLAGRTERHDNHVVDVRRILMQRDIDAGLSRNRDLHGLVADEGDGQCAVCRNRDCERTVGAGRCTNRGAVKKNCRTRDGTPIVPGHCTGNLPLLSARQGEDAHRSNER